MDNKKKARKNKGKKPTETTHSVGTLADMLSPAMQRKLLMHPEDRIKNMVKEARKNPEVIKAEENLKKK
ncbi:MAG: hypothetical protein OCC49_14275 [Fibrobacterales bacterium]